MISRRRQSGFTVLEVSIVVAVLSLMAAFILPTALDQLKTAKVQASIGEAKRLLYVCDIARRNPRSITRHPDLSVTHVHYVIRSFAPTQMMSRYVKGDYDIPSVNAYGKPFLVRFDENNCYVALDLDFSEPGILGQETEEVGGTTRIIVTGKPRGNVSTAWVRHQKRSLLNESSR